MCVHKFVENFLLSENGYFIRSPKILTRIKCSRVQRARINQRIMYTRKTKTESFCTSLIPTDDFFFFFIVSSIETPFAASTNKRQTKSFEMKISTIEHAVSHLSIASIKINWNKSKNKNKQTKQQPSKTNNRERNLFKTVCNSPE